ncbi:RHS repeat-associated core domain-containing protein, partial [Bacteroides graminisolvens]|uniref:RHS repeat-associated core domain-containing protein n=1 Tax=Bacteroides graminisolvens TaxID=477666 RepID=UPI0004689005
KPYALPVYESSPLNRVLEQYGPGQAWQNNSRSAKTAYLTNISGNDTLNCIYYKSTTASADTLVTIVNGGNYETAQLYVLRTTDEDGNPSFEFKDKLGKVVLTRQILRSSGTKVMYDTYYIYDDFGNLSAVLPPLASDGMKSGTSWSNSSSSVLRNYAYLYLYDSRNRCKAKRLPGCDWIYYVYDTGDRLIFAQDGEQRARGEWSFTIPDVFGRVSVSGTCKNTLNALSATSPLNGIVVKATRDNLTGTYKGYALSGITLVSPTVLNVSYYDDYAFMGTNGIPASTDANFKYDAETGYHTRYTASAKTFLTGTLTARLEGSSAPSYLCSVMYYDNRGRVIQTKSQNHLSGGIEKEYVAYNFTGQPTGRKHVHSATGKTTQTELYTYAYDHAGRLTTVKHKLNTDSIVTLAENTYDELGRLKTNKKNKQSALTSSYAYNIRSWMKSVASPLFSQTLYYNDTYAGNTPRYNGNISAMSWSVSGENKTRGYNFTYDNLSRLTGAGYLENGNANDRFNTSYAYDKHGNMTQLSRRGNTGTTTYGLIDNLSMTYAGNQLVKTEDTGSGVTLSQSTDFKNNANLATEYLYDKNGNLIKDYNKSISEISYNVLNLPQTLKISSATNTYTYAADGRKLKTVLGGSKTTDYCGNVIYENGLLKRILVDGGYIENGTYYFYLTDHLGNNRVIASSSGSIVQSNHYYPFGMSFAEGSATSQQPYKYNGKELDTERGLNLYDYSARLMDPALGRFSTVDPMAEKYYSWSPYVYVGNDPVNLIDPDGMDWYQSNEDENRYIWREGHKDIEGYKNVGSSMSIQTGKDSYLNFYQNAKLNLIKPLMLLI